MANNNGGPGISLAQVPHTGVSGSTKSTKRNNIEGNASYATLSCNEFDLFIGTCNDQL